MGFFIAEQHLPFFGGERQIGFFCIHSHFSLHFPAFSLNSPQVCVCFACMSISRSEMTTYLENLASLRVRFVLYYVDLFIFSDILNINLSTRCPKETWGRSTSVHRGWQHLYTLNITDKSLTDGTCLFNANSCIFFLLNIKLAR